MRAAFTETPEQSAVLEPGPFGAEIKGSLIWFPLNDSLALGWTVLWILLALLFAASHPEAGRNTAMVRR